LAGYFLAGPIHSKWQGSGLHIADHAGNESVVMALAPQGTGRPLVIGMDTPLHRDMK